MQKLALGLIASLLLLPIVSFAQTSPTTNTTSSTTMPKPPASWIAFQQQENVKRAAFFKQMQADRNAFLSANPDAKSFLDQMRAASQARMAAWRAAHPRKTTTPAATTPTTP